jgi:hypothetical protein
VTTPTNQPTALRALDWDAIRARLKPLYDSREYWLSIVHVDGVKLLDAVARHYQGGEGLTVFLIYEAGRPFAVFAARKRHMLAREFAELLRKALGVDIDARVLVERDVQIMTPNEAMDAVAEAIAARLFADQGLALAA